ncbi:MAG TPA: glycosyltransferase family 4 protein, partial [Candidatus Polarisedimenticolaceae bacterium]|nr:glycosyltransferase family 4 protein [Candidatus Polarisedimenticolaceae bacterium]
IRAWQIAAALEQEHDVALVSTTACEGVSHPRFRVDRVERAELRRLVDACDVVILQGHVLHQHPAIASSSKVVIADLYDPLHLEDLEQTRDLGREERWLASYAMTRVVVEQLGRGDFFLCASEKQRDFWLGHLAAVGRINPATYDADATLRDLIAVVPFGVSDVPPRHTRRALKGVVPGIGAEDKVILWGGGIYDWLDPLTLLRAVDRLRLRVPEVRLCFLGLKHPSPLVPPMRTQAAARELAAELGLTGTHVFFNEGWVEYEDRQNYLLEADVGVSAHLLHVEAEFSFRTRIVDYLWAALPVVATAGDALGELVERRGAGIAVPPGDVAALEHALFALLTDRERNASSRAAAAALAENLGWTKVLTPLVEFCRSPRRAPDLVHAKRHFGVMRLRQDLRRISRLTRQGDWRLIYSKVRARLERAIQG